MADKTPEENRRSQRLALPLPCALHRGAPAEGPGQKALLGNISVHGALLIAPQPAAPGERLTLSLTLGGRHFEALPATVVWAKEGECGVRFPDSWAGPLQEALLDPRAESILFLEDDAALRAGLTQRLAAAGYLVASAGAAPEAVKLFGERHFDLAVLDLNLPEGRGMDVLRAIRTHAKRFRTPVIILTADARMESKLAGLASGADQ